MKNKPGNYNNYLISIIIILLFFGCTTEQTHKTLVFFFDGVDKVVFFNDYLSHDSLKSVSDAKRAAILKKNRPDMVAHKPYKEKKCDACHTPDKRLIMPMPALCFKCHKDFSTTYQVVHGPVASGACLNCHNQHSSKYAKLLIRQGQQICLFCHNSSQVFASKVHRDIEDAECTLCHNPHGGNNRFMIKGSISHDANRLALMTDLTYRHLYGQIFCKVPGDVGHVQEVYILDAAGNKVATAHPDANGKFYLANLHPDQDYTFRFKVDVPDCRINILDENGTVLYLLDKNKKQKYVLDKSAYETVHEAINDAHELGDTLKWTPISSSTAVNIDQPVVKDTTAVAGANTHTVAEDSAASQARVAENAAPQPAAEVPAKPGKIEVSELPPATPAEKEAETREQVKKEPRPVVNEAPPVNADTGQHTSKIVVKELPAATGAEEQTKAAVPVDTAQVPPQGTAGQINQANSHSKITVTSLSDTVFAQQASLSQFGTAPTAMQTLRCLAAGGVRLPDLTLQVGRYMDGTVVCILNDSADFIDIAPVNAKGEFYLYGFLYYRINLPSPNSGILSQTIYLNDKMQIIESVHKRLQNGRYVYVPNSKEPPGKRQLLTIYANNQNARLFGAAYFTESSPVLTADGESILDRAIGYLEQHPPANLYLAPHAGTMGTAAFNAQLSAGRARAVINYLLSKGVKRARIKGKEYEKSKVIQMTESGPASQEENEKNRRVDVYIK